MNPHEIFWCGLTVPMVMLLPRCKGFRVFTAIQFVQLLEIPLVIIWPGWNPWHELVKANVGMDIIAVLFARKQFPWVIATIMAMDMLKAFREAPFDCDFQLIISPLSWVIYWLNNLTIILLIVYSCRSRNLLALGEKCTITFLNRVLSRMPMMTA